MSRSAPVHPHAREKTYAIDVLTLTLIGSGYHSEYKQALTMPAPRRAKALRRAARLFPGQDIRARLIQSPLAGGAA
jgi:hypothetical protein